MIFSTLLVSSLLASVLALPSSKERFDARVARRTEGAHLSQPYISNGADGVTSSNWAGGIMPEAAGTWKSVTATFVVPTPQEPAGASGPHAASAWVGIDGATCTSAILQTGIDMRVNGSAVSYDAWYEWLPVHTHDFAGIDIHAGDRITVTVTASSATAGTAVITNHSTGQTVRAALTSTAHLCMKDAEWIVEDFSTAAGTSAKYQALWGRL